MYPPDCSIPPEVQNVQNADDLNQNVEHGKSGGESPPPYEVMRDHTDNAVHLSSPILHPHTENVDPNIGTIDSTPKNTAEKETDTLRSIHTLTPMDQSPQQGGPSSPLTEAREVSDSFGENTHLSSSVQNVVCSTQQD